MENPSLKLNSEWTFWYASRKEKDHHIPYTERLTEISTFNTLEDFLKTYIYLKPINELDRNNDLGIFKKGYQPLWESCPDSGFWFYRFPVHDDGKEINYRWEKLLFALIGEQFDEKHILGAKLSMRARETILELWFNYFGIEDIKNGVAKKFREILSIEGRSTLYFNDNKSTAESKSTLKNAETYSFKKQRKFTYY